ncbi:MAG: hypothetical protein FWG81_05580 [Betaproteobacteria bacterium]|nr:hypothetical protein [Betaproteobacteria bacterium]
MFANVLPFLQLALPIIFSLIAAIYLSGVIQRLLTDMCGTEDRARFWTRCAVVTMLAVPLMLVLLAIESPYDCETTRCAVRALRQTLAWTAGGILAAVSVVAYVVGRYIMYERRTACLVRN